MVPLRRALAAADALPTASTSAVRHPHRLHSPHAAPHLSAAASVLLVLLCCCSGADISLRAGVCSARRGATKAGEQQERDNMAACSRPIRVMVGCTQTGSSSSGAQFQLRPSVDPSQRCSRGGRRAWSLASECWLTGKPLAAAMDLPHAIAKACKWPTFLARWGSAAAPFTHVPGTPALSGCTPALLAVWCVGHAYARPGGAQRRNAQPWAPPAAAVAAVPPPRQPLLIPRCIPASPCLPRSIVLLYWSVAFVALSYHIKWFRLQGRRNDVLGW